MPLKIVDALEAVVRATPDVHSILILDKDGVPIVSAGMHAWRSRLLCQLKGYVHKSNATLRR